MKVNITITGTAQACNEWTFATATVQGKEYRAIWVRFNEPSKHGIDQGRISKLWINNQDRSEVVNYDRGWDIQPQSAEAKAILAELLKEYN